MNAFKFSLLLMLVLFVVQGAEANDSYEVWKKEVLIEMDARIEDPSGPPTVYDYTYGQLSKDGGRMVAKKRIKECVPYMVSHANDPVLFYIRGWLGWMEYIFFYDDMEKRGTTERLFGAENQNMIKGYQVFYYKAVDLDDKVDAPDHLDHYMLSTIDGVLAPTDLSERVLKKILKLSQQRDVSVDGQEWTTFEFLLALYAEAKDYDNYLKTVDEMIARFPNSPRMNELLEYKRHVQEVIAKRDGKAAQIDTYAQADAYAQPKAAAVQTPAKAIATQKPVAPKVSHETANTSTSDENTLLWWLLGGGALLALGGLYISRRKKG
jgi:LPXTG-motif cell wall-anchored protein